MSLMWLMLLKRGPNKLTTIKKIATFINNHFVLYTLNISFYKTIFYMR